MYCTYDTHFQKQKPIQGFCFNDACKETMVSCILCLRDYHSQHSNDIRTIDETMENINEKVRLAKDWNQKVNDGYGTIQKISKNIKLLLQSEEQNLIELEKNLQNQNYQTQLQTLITLKNWCQTIKVFNHQLQGDYLLVFLRKIDSLTQAILKKQNSFMQIQNLDNSQESNPINNQVNDYWDIYEKQLERQIKSNWIEDIEFIRKIIKDKKQLIQQLQRKVEIAYSYIEKISKRWEKYYYYLNELKSNLEKAQYREFCKRIKEFNYKADELISILNSEESNNFLGTLKKIQQFYQTFEKFRVVLDKRNQRQIEIRQKEFNDLIQNRRRPRIIEEVNTKKCANGHVNENIVAFCFLNGCRESNLCCTRCLQHIHNDHLENTKTVFETKQIVINELSDIVQRLPKVDDTFRNMQEIWQTIKIVLGNQKTKLIQLHHDILKVELLKLKDYLNDIQILKQWNLILSQNLRHSQNPVQSKDLLLKDLLIKISKVFQALYLFEITLNGDVFTKIFSNLGNGSHNEAVSNNILQNQQDDLNAIIEFLRNNQQNGFITNFSIGVLGTLIIYKEEICSIILTYIQLIDDCMKVFEISPLIAEILQNSKNYQNTLKGKIEKLQNQNVIDLDFLDKQLRFSQRFYNVIKQIFCEINQVSDKFLEFESKLVGKSRKIIVKNGQLKFEYVNLVDLEENKQNQIENISQFTYNYQDLNKFLKLNQLKLLAQYSHQLFEQGEIRFYVGVALNNKDESEKAITTFDELILLNRNCTEAFIQKGIALFKLKHYDQAIIEYDKAINLNPTISLTYFNKGNALINQEKFSEARESYQIAIDKKHRDYQLSYNMGIVLQKLNKPAEAVNHFKDSISLNSDNYSSHFELGNALQQTGDLNGAIKSYDNAIYLNQKEFEVYFQKAQALQQQNNKEQAISVYETGYSINPNHFLTNYNLGYLLQSQNNYLQAKKYLEEATKLNKEDYNSHLCLGQVLQNLKENAKAIQYFDIAIRLNSGNDPTVYLNKGYSIYYFRLSARKLKKYQEATQTYEKGLLWDPFNFKLNFHQGQNQMNLIGVALYEDNQMEKSKQHLKNAINKNPGHSDSYTYMGMNINNLGCVLIDEENYEGALGFLKQAIQRNPQSFLANQSTGFALLQLNQNNEAIPFLNYAIQLQPNDSNTYLCKGNQKGNALGTALQKMNNFQEAIQVYSQAININPNCGVAYNNIASCLTFQGRNQEALYYYNKAYDINPNNEKFFQGKIQALRNLGKNSEADLLVEHQRLGKRR